MLSMLATFCYTVHTGAELRSVASDFYVADMEDPPVLDGDIICIAPSELPERSRKWVTLEADALDYS